MGRKVFQDLGTYESVRDSIREDEALGMKAKNRLSNQRSQYGR
jgi:hypothetical protein